MAPRTGSRRSDGGRDWPNGLHHDEIVLLEVQLFIRHDEDFGGIFTLQSFDTRAFLILKQSCDGRMGSH